MQDDRPNGVLSVICPSVVRAGVKTAQPLDRLTLQSNPARSEVPPLPVQKDTAWKRRKNRTEGGIVQGLGLSLVPEKETIGSMSSGSGQQ